jgi:hypothetical protein
MFVGMNELELQLTSAAHGIQTRMLYLTLPGESFAGLAAHHLVLQVGVAIVPSTPPLDTLGGASGRASPVRLWR